MSVEAKQALDFLPPPPKMDKMETPRDRQEADKTQEMQDRYVYRGLRTLSIMPTFTCPAACDDCGTRSSPHERSNLELAAILAAIDEAKLLGFYNVVFTGGEATLRWADLLKGIRHASDLGFPVRLVTNAHWATSLMQARERLGVLISHGLSEINYSTGDQHTRFVPIDRVANAIVAACERSFAVHVMVELKEQTSITREQLLAHPLVAGLSAEQHRWLSVASSPWMPLRHDSVYRYPEGVATCRQNFAVRGGCDNVLQTYTVQADGRIGACCGLGLRVIPELNVAQVDQSGFLRRAIQAAEEDFLKLWIHYHGPEKILKWAARYDTSIKWEGLYAHHCQFCHRLYHDEAVRSVIREHWQEVIGEVLQAAWLEEICLPDTLAQARQHATHEPVVT